MKYLILMVIISGCSLGDITTIPPIKVGDCLNAVGRTAKVVEVGKMSVRVKSETGDFWTLPETTYHGLVSQIDCFGNLK